MLICLPAPAQLAEIYNPLGREDTGGHYLDAHVKVAGNYPELEKPDVHANQATTHVVAEDRREKVKEAMLHAWGSYVKYAWGSDELQVADLSGHVLANFFRRIQKKARYVVPCLLMHVVANFVQPQSKRGRNEYGGLGVTIVDSLDTLYIMELKDEFQKAKEYAPVCRFCYPAPGVTF